MFARCDEDAKDAARHRGRGVGDTARRPASRRRQRPRRQLIEELESEKAARRISADGAVVLEGDAHLDLPAVRPDERPHAVAHREGVSGQRHALQRRLERGGAGRHVERAARLVVGKPGAKLHSRGPKDARAVLHAPGPDPEPGAAGGRRFFAPSIDSRAAATIDAAATSSGGRFGT